MGTQFSDLKIQNPDPPSRFNNPASILVDNRKLTGTGLYNLTYSQDEWELEEDLNEVQPATSNSVELNQVVDQYKHILAGGFVQGATAHEEEVKQMPML